ncbi:MAG TPA: NAD-binding protein, partial [Burkholderiales bacterium]|nr:NAD-binding protein [Burkholderiales bacterium]
DAAEAEVLIQAHVARAHLLVVAIPDTFRAQRMIDIARRLNPDIQAILRAHTDDDVTLLQRENAGPVFMGERELAQSMLRHVLEQVSGRSTPR